MRGTLQGLSETDQALIARKPGMDAAAESVEAVRADIDSVRTSIDELVGQLGPSDTVSSATDKYAAEGGQIARLVQTEHASWRARILKEVKKVSEMAHSAPSHLDEGLANWDSEKAAFDAAYETTVERATANRQQLQQIRDLERRHVELQKQQTVSRTNIEELGSPEADYATARRRWNELHREKIAALETQCASFSELSNGYIQATMIGSLDTDRVRSSLKQLFTGMNVREQRTDVVCQTVSDADDPLATWDQILAELEQLTSRTNTEGPLPPTPLLDRCGIIASEKTRIASNLKPERWLDLALGELEFTPVFRYCTNKDKAEYIAFSDASAGQQATALLTVLLNQAGGPLIIDQPEDDADSKMMSEIVALIWKAKSERQLIFASHNANFVVNGDAELVICCDYVRSGDQTGGKIKSVGAIDTRQVRDDITAVTEGGEKAFKLRKQKYGF